MNEINEIKKCPFCGRDAHIQIGVRDFYVDVKLLCDGCDAIFKCTEFLNEEFMEDKTIPEVVNECLTNVLERWNKRAKEPQEKKETRFERLLKEERQADELVCCLAYRDKHKGKNCATEICGECEFCDCENAINYLLAPCEGKDDFVAVSNLISKAQSSANEILEALRANTKEEK